MATPNSCLSFSLQSWEGASKEEASSEAFLWHLRLLRPPRHRGLPDANAGARLAATHHLPRQQSRGAALLRHLRGLRPLDRLLQRWPDLLTAILHNLHALGVSMRCLGVLLSPSALSCGVCLVLNDPFKRKNVYFFVFFFKLRISHLKERGTVFTVFVWEDAVHHLMLILLEQHWSCLRSHNLILRVCTAGGGGGKMIRIYGGGC